MVYFHICNEKRFEVLFPQLQVAVVAQELTCLREPDLFASHTSTHRIHKDTPTPTAKTFWIQQESCIGPSRRQQGSTKAHNTVVFPGHHIAVTCTFSPNLLLSLDGGYQHLSYLFMNCSKPCLLSSMKDSSKMPSSPRKGSWRFNALPGSGGTTI